MRTESSQTPVTKTSRSFRATRPAAVVFGMLAVLTAAMAFVLPSEAQVPRPRPAPVTWEFAFEPGPVRVATVNVNGEDRLYLYTTFEVANFSGQDRTFAPAFTLQTDSGIVLRSGAGSGVPSRVTEVIRSRLRDPLLKGQVEIVGTLSQGEANAKRGLVVWPVLDDGMNEARIFVAGLSGEFTRYQTVDPVTGRSRTHQLRKSKLLEFALPGNVRAYENSPATLVRDEWVMR